MICSGGGTRLEIGYLSNVLHVAGYKAVAISGRELLVTVRTSLEAHVFGLLSKVEVLLVYMCCVRFHSDDVVIYYDTLQTKKSTRYQIK